MRTLTKSSDLCQTTEWVSKDPSVQVKWLVSRLTASAQIAEAMVSTLGYGLSNAGDGDVTIEVNSKTTQLLYDQFAMTVLSGITIACVSFSWKLSVLRRFSTSNASTITK